MAKIVCLISGSIKYPDKVSYLIPDIIPNNQDFSDPTVIPSGLCANKNGAITTANNTVTTINLRVHSPPRVAALS